MRVTKAMLPWMALLLLMAVAENTAEEEMVSLVEESATTAESAMDNGTETNTDSATSMANSVLVTDSADMEVNKATDSTDSTDDVIVTTSAEGAQPENTDLTVTDASTAEGGDTNTAGGDTNTAGGATIGSHTESVNASDSQEMATSASETVTSAEAGNQTDTVVVVTVGDLSRNYVTTVADLSQMASVTESAVDETATTVAQVTEKTVPAGPGKIYKVTSVLVEPYLFEKDGQRTGLVMDLLKHIGTELDVSFDVTVVNVDDEGSYGKKNDDGTWTGMIGEVVNGDADMAVAPLTITLDREEVVDFTMAFFKSSASAIIGSRKFGQELTSLKDLVDNDFRFAVKDSSNIHDFLKASKHPLYQHILASIKANGGLKADIPAGISQTRYDIKYAFLMDSEIASLQDPCDFKIITTDIYKRQYGIAVRNQSPLRDSLNRALSKLENSGTLNKIVAKWFPEEECSGCAIKTGSIFNTILFVCLAFIPYKLFA